MKMCREKFSKADMAYLEWAFKNMLIEGIECETVDTVEIDWDLVKPEWPAKENYITRKRWVITISEVEVEPENERL
jgi:hypothetical protein